MTKKKRELIEILLDNITPDDWPVEAKFAAQDKKSWGKNKLMFYKQDYPPFVKTGATIFSGNASGNVIALPELCCNWNKTIVTRDEFVKRWNERVHSTTNATTPPAQQESHTEETKPIQQDEKFKTGGYSGTGSVNAQLKQKSATDTQIDKIITERGSNYGRFEDGAEIMQQLKHIAHTSQGWKRMGSNQREAMDMILHKIGRILNGDPNYADSWIDIEGYSKLISDWLKGESK